MSFIHTIRPGDCIASLAERHGFADPRTIYDHADNAELKRSRPQLTELVPGDQVVIPDKDLKEIAAPAGAKHRFKVRLPKVFLELVLMIDEEPLASKAYVLTVGDATFSGTTDGDGKLKQRIPAAATEGRIEVKDPAIVWELSLGSLQPPDAPEGAAARLFNLGLSEGLLDASDAESLGSALRFFQAKLGIDVTGELDDTTKDKLKSGHDG